MTLDSFLSTYGYAAVVLGTFLEGETILVLAGFAAYREYLELQWVILAAFAGTLAADQFYFNLGRSGGTRLLVRWPSWQTKAGRVLRLLDRHQTLVILSVRFLYGMRTVAPFVIGLSGVSRVKYLLLTSISTAVWAVTVGTLGYLFGHALDRLLEDMRRYELVALGVVAALGAALWGIHRLRERARKARNETQE